MYIRIVGHILRFTFVTKISLIKIKHHGHPTIGVFSQNAHFLCIFFFKCKIYKILKISKFCITPLAFAPSIGKFLYFFHVLPTKTGSIFVKFMHKGLVSLCLFSMILTVQHILLFLYLRLPKYVQNEFQIRIVQIFWSIPRNQRVYLINELYNFCF